MIDIHSHILYRIDDGASGPAESLDLARIYVAAGYRQVVATPHAVVDSLPTNNYAKMIQALVKQFNSTLFEQGVGLDVLPGMEVGLDPLLPKLVAKREILTLSNSHYLLVETSFSQLPLNWWQIVFSLATEGIIVIFAHPERCAQVAYQPELLDLMVQAGAKIQVNWGSFAGVYGRRVVKVARAMARKGIIHCLATDSHNVMRSNAGNVNEIGVMLMELIGEKNLYRIAVQNPARVIHGKPLLDMEQGGMPKKKRKKWGIWRGHSGSIFSG